MKELEIIKLIKNPDTPEKDYNLACNFIIDRYTPMIHKHWWLLQKQMNESGYVYAIEDEYYEEAYEALFKAIQKVDISRVYDEKFKLLQLASWYIGNVRTKFIKQIIRKNSKVKSLTTMSIEEDDDSNSPDPDVERSYYEREGYKYNPAYIYEIKEGEENCVQGVNKCLKYWTKEEKKVFRMLKNGKKKAEIATKLNIRPAKVYAMANKMSNDLKKELDYENLIYG